MAPPKGKAKHGTEGGAERGPPGDEADAVGNLAAAPLVLSVSLPARDAPPRWKEVVEPAPGRFMHHLELYRVKDVDAQVRAWLRAAWEAG